MNTSGGSSQTNFVRGNRYPDVEDINNNKTLDQTEAFYEYVLDIKRLGDSNELDTSALAAKGYYRQSITVTQNGITENGTAYRFRSIVVEL
ncbi:MAG: hypothetical protein IPG00_16065 [Saprospiraceae bacterium]|nr:hypothetical protein [Saprospiraceae bacterium]